MMKVRDKLPVRRSNPSKNPSGHNWSAHKSDLKQDFHEHCAYCGSYDGFRHTYFEVDHFIPKELVRSICVNMTILFIPANSAIITN